MIGAGTEALGCDPIEGMARIAMDTANPAELRGRMYAELAGYVAPKRRAIDVSSEDGTASSGVHEIVVRVVKPQPYVDDVADGTSLHQVGQHPVLAIGIERDGHGTERGIESEHSDLITELTRARRDSATPASY